MICSYATPDIQTRQSADLAEVFREEVQEPRGLGSGEEVKIEAGKRDAAVYGVGIGCSVSIELILARKLFQNFRARDLRLDKLRRIIMQLRPPQADFGDLSIWRVPTGSG
jgi:hypothetical protein